MDDNDYRVIPLLCAWQFRDHSYCKKRAAYTVAPWDGDMRDGMFCAQHAKAKTAQLLRLEQRAEAPRPDPKTGLGVASHPVGIGDDVGYGGGPKGSPGDQWFVPPAGYSHLRFDHKTGKWERVG